MISNILILLIPCCILFLISLFIRLLPAFFSKNRGTDSHFYLLCAEYFNKFRKIPITYPKRFFLLEPAEQWYPPGFIIILGLFSQKFIKKYYWIIPSLIDSLTTVSIFLITYYLLNNLILSLVSAFIYGISIYPIRESIIITSRTTGSFLFLNTVFYLFLLGNHFSIYTLIPFFLFGYAMMMSHKLSTQAFVVVALAFSIFFQNTQFIIFCILLFVFSLIFSKGFYYKVLLAHFDILGFWFKRWKFFNLDHLYDSEIYKHFKTKKTVPLYRHDIKTYIRPVLTLLYNIPLYACSVITIFWLMKTNQSLPLYQGMCIWIASVTIFAFSTFWIPYLRCLGFCNQYFKFLLFPTIYLSICPLFYPIYHKYQVHYSILVFSAIAFTLWIYLKYTQDSYRDYKNAILLSNNALELIISYLANHANKDQIRLSALPTYPSEKIVFECRIPVLFGGHGYGLKELAPFYPIIQKPIQHFLVKYQITHLLIDSRFVDPNIFGLDYSIEVEIQYFKLLKLASSCLATKQFN
jgi:hypothetical protein